MAQPLKIGFVLDDRLDKPDGVQQYTKLLGEWFTARGHDVHYLVGESPGLSDDNVHHLSRTFKVRFNKNRMEIPLPASRAKIKQLLKDQSFDVVHVMMPYSPMLAEQVINLASKNIIIVGTFHILPYARLEKAASRLLSLILTRSRRKFDQIFSVSEAAQEFAKKTFKVNSEVLPNVVKLSEFSKGKKLKKFSDRKNIVFLGRLVSRKGAKQALSAFTRLCESEAFAKNNRLIICGDGPQRQDLEKQVEELKSNHPEVEVIFTGFLSEPDKKDYLATADVAVFPATGGESFGIVLIEAMAAKARVVLAGDNPGYRTVMQPTQDALFDPDDTSAFAALIAHAIGDREFINKTHHAQQQMVKQYDVEAVGEKLEKEYRRLIAAKAKNMHT